MKSLEEITKAQQQYRPRYYDDAQKDRMLALVLELAEQVCVLRDSLDTRDRLAAGGVVATSDAVDDYEISDEVVAERLERHQAFFEETLRRLTV